MKLSLTSLLLCTLAVTIAACATETSPDGDEPSLAVESALQKKDDYTTVSVCEACGCTATMVACNCGTPPRPAKLECIRNGGPSKVLSPALGGAATLRQ